MKIVFALCCVAACSGPAPLTDALVKMDAGPDAGPPLDAPPVPKSGLVSIAQNATSSNASAIFSMGDVFGAPVGTDGPCTVTMNPVQRGMSAGVITLTGTTTALTMTPSGTAPNVEYTTTPTEPDLLFTAGAALTVTAAGGPDFPAFTSTVTGPTTLTGFTPPTSLSRSGYTATWTAGTAAQVWVIMFATGGASNFAYVVCKVPDNGSFTVPATTFALIPSSYTSGAVGIGRASSQDVVTTAGHVAVVAFSNVVSMVIPLGS